MADYVQMIINSFFTGLGSASGIYGYEKWIKPRMEKVHKKVNKLKKKFKT